MCLFVATSITDPNVRRVLDAAHREAPNDFDYFVWDTPHKGQLSGVDAVVQEAFSEVFCEAHQKLGLKPVWYFKRKDAQDRYSDVADILDAIRET